MITPFIGKFIVPSLTHNYLNSLVFSQKSTTTLRIIGECKGKQALFFHQSPEVLASLRKVATVESTESSNRIEGITAPHPRVEKIVLKKTTPRNRSEQEIAGYRDALSLVHESAKHMKLTTGLILQLHGTISRYLPDPGGKYKITDNEIVEKNPDGSIKKVRFKPVAAFKTSEAMEKLIENYQLALQSTNLEPLIIIPLFILDFLCIHPFSDGNGRVGRLLTLLLLYHFDYQVGRYISLERIIEESKETYYEALEKSSSEWHESKQNVHPWLQYFWGMLLRAYREFEDRVGTIRKGKGAKSDQVRQAVNKKIKPFSISEIEADCPGVSRDMVRLVLRQLRNEGLIVSLGKGRNAKWVLK